MTIKKTLISFPDYKLTPREAHYLRGYIGNLFKEKSQLLHNHLEANKFNYKYPLVQYKVIDNIAYIIGINEGAKLLQELFHKVNKLELQDRILPVYTKNILSKEENFGEVENQIKYEFITPWIALNSNNYKKYKITSEKMEKIQMLQSILVGNILSLCKGLEYTVTKRIIVDLDIWKVDINYKNVEMIGFYGNFTCNIQLPDFLGLGKSVSRGFGTIKRGANGVIY